MRVKKERLMKWMLRWKREKKVCLTAMEIQKGTVLEELQLFDVILESTKKQVFVRME